MQLKSFLDKYDLTDTAFRDAVFDALGQLTQNGWRNNSTVYDLVHEGRRFPPKEVIRTALGLLGKTWQDSDAYGGPKANKPLEQLGFVIEKRNDGQPIVTPSSVEGAKVPMPTNLILYGPPGTGKTFSTAEEAVRLCGEPTPEDRGALMDIYQRLLATGRIEFVTFHQSMSYEDFVEGRQPMTDSDDDADGSSVGFRLDTVPGVFRRIAKRAETSQGRPTDDDAVALPGRHVFKMSIGRANDPEDAHLFDEALADGYALLSWYDIDWSDEKYAKREAIIEECKRQGHDVTAQSGGVQMPFIFRNWVREGDIVIVSKGNSRFRAIGEFTGGYEFHPRPEGRYAHRRAVRWHWTDPEGVPASEIYKRKFTQKSIYMLHDSELKSPALERYINSQHSDAPARPSPSS